jgi:predicted CoA-substrate-specific enzyme activase
VAGIDIGALFTKTVILDDEQQIIAQGIVQSGANSKKTAAASFNMSLDSAGLKQSDIQFIVSTGYGRAIVDFSHAQVTEISCHARGIHSIFPEVRTIIDIGGQDSKAIKIDEDGKVVNFVMNDKCAAGTGRFLEVMSQALEIELGEMGKLSLHATREVPVSSTCTVFAESEVISLISSGEEKENILAGIHQSIARRTVGLVERIGVVQQVAMSGGVAKNIGVSKSIEALLNTKLQIADEPQLIGALGAALVAHSRASYS